MGTLFGDHRRLSPVLRRSRVEWYRSCSSITHTPLAPAHRNRDGGAGLQNRKTGLRGSPVRFYPLMPVVAMPSTRDFWKIRKMMVAGMMDRVDMARVDPMSDPEEGSLNSCSARETGRMLARFT